jgi:hypothetical protein
MATTTRTLRRGARLMAGGALAWCAGASLHLALERGAHSVREAVVWIGMLGAG